MQLANRSNQQISCGWVHSPLGTHPPRLLSNLLSRSSLTFQKGRKKEIGWEILLSLGVGGEGGGVCLLTQIKWNLAFGHQSGYSPKQEMWMMVRHRIGNFDSTQIWTFHPFGHLMASLLAPWPSHGQDYKNLVATQDPIRNMLGYYYYYCPAYKCSFEYFFVYRFLILNIYHLIFLKYLLF